jgi:hypothetical protein
MVEAATSASSTPRRTLTPEERSHKLLRGRAGGHAGDLLLAAHHRRRASSRCSASRARRAASSPARVHQDLRDALGGPLSITVAPALRDLLICRARSGRARSPGLAASSIRKVYAPFVHVALRKPGHHRAHRGDRGGLGAAAGAAPGAGSSCRRSTRATSCTCPPRCRASPSRRRGGSSSGRTRSCAEVPEVELSVLGKVGPRRDPTDPAPLSMVETVVHAQAPRAVAHALCRRRWYVGLGAGCRWRPAARARSGPRVCARDPRRARARAAPRLRCRAGPTPLRSPSATASTCRPRAFARPWASRSRRRPRRHRGRRARRWSVSCRSVRGTRSVFYERSSGRTYVDIVPDREALARHGLLRRRRAGAGRGAPIGGRTITTTVEGGARFPVVLRFTEDLPLEPRRPARHPAPRCRCAPARRGGRGGGHGPARPRWRGSCCARGRR